MRMRNTGWLVTGQGVANKKRSKNGAYSPDIVPDGADSTRMQLFDIYTFYLGYLEMLV